MGDIRKIGKNEIYPNRQGLKKRETLPTLIFNVSYIYNNDRIDKLFAVEQKSLCTTGF